MSRLISDHKLYTYFICRCVARATRRSRRTHLVYHTENTTGMPVPIVLVAAVVEEISSINSSYLRREDYSVVQSVNKHT